MGSEARTMAEQVAEAVTQFQTQRTGHAPEAVALVLSNDALIVTLHEAFSSAEITLSQTADGAAKVQEYRRQLFASSVAALPHEIGHITGVHVREAAVEVETTTGAVVHAFTSGVMVQVFRLGSNISAAKWNGNEA